MTHNKTTTLPTTGKSAYNGTITMSGQEATPNIHFNANFNGSGGTVIGTGSHWGHSITITARFDKKGTLAGNIQVRGSLENADGIVDGNITGANLNGTWNSVDKSKSGKIVATLITGSSNGWKWLK